MAPHALDLASFWPRLLAGGLAGILTWVVACQYGSLVVDRFLKVGETAARFGISAALGYSFIGTAVGALALLHAIRPLTVEGLLVVALLARIPSWIPRRRVPHANPSAISGHPFAPQNAADWAAYAVMAGAFFTALIAAALPAVWWDPIAYHLPIVAAALAHGTFAFAPAMVQSGFPSLGEAAALPAYAIAGSAGAAMVSLGAGMCLAQLAGCLAARVAPNTGVAAAMLVMSCPLWLWLAPSFYVDVPFAMLTLAAIAVALETRGQTGLVAGWLCGAVAAVKYSGLGVCVIVLAALVIVARSDRWRSAGGFMAGAMLVAGGWYVRTLLVTGDPVYPFLSAHLSHVPQTAAFATRYVEMTRDWCTGGNSLGDLASLPYRLLVTPRDFCGDPGVALRAGIVFAVASVILIRSALALALVTVALTIAWFFASQQWRFAVAPAATYAAVVAAGTSVLGARLRSIYVLALSVLGAFSVALNWLPNALSQASQSIVPAENYLLDRQSGAQYLDDRLETFAAARWLAQRIHPGERVLALDDVRDYYFPANTIWGNPYYQQAVALDWQAPATQRYAPVRALGIRYIVVNANQAYVHRTPTGVDWVQLASDARSELHEVFRANDTIVYELSPR